VQVAHGPDTGVEDQPPRTLLVLAVRERGRKREELVEHDPDRVHVSRGAEPAGAAANLLGSHVGHGAELRAGVRDPVDTREAREPEVEDDDTAFRGQHHVRRLEVAVQNTPLVCVFDRAGHACSHAHGHLRPAPVEQPLVPARRTWSTAA
jgi:hypothetical protein